MAHNAFQKITRWLTVGAVALLAAGWLIPLNANTEKALAQQTNGGNANPNPKAPKAASPNNGANATNGNNSSSLNNGPQIQPKATIQSIPVIQQRERLKPRT